LFVVTATSPLGRMPQPFVADGFTVIVPEASALPGKNRVTAKIKTISMERNLNFVFIFNSLLNYEYGL
jgi:hypothetical protein